MHVFLVPSMWFWSVSWSTNCPVYFLFFLVDQRKICPVSDLFCSLSWIFCPVFFENVVLVSLLANQLSGQFLIFLGRPKKNDQSQRPDKFFFVQSLDFLSILDIREWPISKKDWTKIQEGGQKKLSGLWAGTIFFWLTKEKMRNRLDNWSAKETDQNHMDAPIIFKDLLINNWHVTLELLLYA